MSSVVLRTDHLVLRPPTVDDVDAITAACQDPTILKWVAIPSPYTTADGRSFVTDFSDTGWANGTAATWAIFENEVLAGIIGLNIRNESGELGYWIAPHARGKRFSTEAIEAVVAYSFAEDGLNLPRISWTAFAGNDASYAAAKRVGFEIHGPIRGHVIHRGQRVDCWLGTLYRDA